MTNKYAEYSRHVCVRRQDQGTWARAAFRHRASVPAGVRVHKLVSPAVLANERYRDQLRRIMAAGGQVRISGSPPVE